LPISNATLDEACVLGENFRKDVSYVSNMFHGVGRIQILIWHEMLYHLRRFHRQITESLYHCITFLPECWLQIHNNILLLGYL